MSNALLNSAWTATCQTPAAKLVLVRLADRADDSGQCWPSTIGLAEDTGLTRQYVAEVVATLARDGHITVIRSKGLCNRYRVHPRTKGTCKQSLHVDTVDTTCKQSPQPPVDTVDSTCKHSLHEPSRTHSEPSKNHHIRAEDIYAAYPLKVGKPKALQAITKALKSIRPEELLSKTQAFSKARNGDTDYCPNPATWFNQARYNDDPATWNRNGKPQHVPEAKQRHEQITIPILKYDH